MMANLNQNPICSSGVRCSGLQTVYLMTVALMLSLLKLSFSTNTGLQAFNSIYLHVRGRISSATAISQ